MEQQEKKCMQLRLQALKPEITQICWQDGLRYLQLRWFLQYLQENCTERKKTDEIKNLGKRSVENHMGDFCHFVSRTFVSPDIWHEMLQRNVWKHEP